MAKLKFDRSINVTLIKGETVTVPTDEVWKVTGHPPNEIEINGRVLTHLNEITVPFMYTLGGVLI